MFQVSSVSLALSANSGFFSLLFVDWLKAALQKGMKKKHYYGRMHQEQNNEYTIGERVHWI